MRILILLNSRFPTHKAYGLQVLAMARGFVEAGSEVVVAYPRRTNDVPPHLSGVRWCPYGPYLNLRHPLLFPLFRLLGLFGLRRVLEEHQPDACLVNDPVQAAFFPRPWKVLWDIHDLPDPRRWSRRWLVRRILRRVQGCMSTNQLKLDRLKGMGFPLPPSIVLPNPVTFDPEVYRSITREEARQRCGMGNGRAIVYAGQLYDWKGVDTLIQSAAFLGPNDHLYLVGGEGKDLERCQRLAASLPSASASVTFVGLRPSDEIPYWLRAADIVVIPNSGKHRLSVEDTNPLKAVEAMAAESVVVASDLPAIRAALEGYPSAVFCPPDQPQDLARAIGTASSMEPGKRLWEQGTSRVLMTAKERAERFTAFFRNSLKQESFSSAFTRGVFWVSSGAGGIRVIGFLTSLVLLRFFSLHEYGTYQLVLSVGGLLALFSFQGIEQVVIAAGARAVGRGAMQEVRSIGRGYFLLRMGLGVLLWILAFFHPSIISSHYGNDVLLLLRDYSWVFILLPLEKVLSYHFSIHRSFHLVSAFLLLQEAIKLGCILLSFFVFSAGLRGVVLSMPIAMALSLLVVFPFVGLSYCSLHVRQPMRTLWPLLRTQGLWVVGMRVIREVERNARPLFIQVFLGREAVAIFSLMEKAYSYLSSLFPLDDVLMPSIAAESENRHRLQQVLERGIKYSVPFYGSIACLFFFLSPSLVAVAFPQYLPAVPLLRLVCAYLPFIGIALLLTSFYAAHLEQQKQFWLIALRFVFFCFFAPLLVTWFGLMGIALEFILTPALFNVMRYLWLQRTYPELRVRWKSVFSWDDYDRLMVRRLANGLRQRFSRR